jgi:histidyl-tRNA synthetase
MIEPRELGGFPEFPPELMIPRERMMATFRATFVAFGYRPIGTPHVERMEVLAGKGAGSDEVVRQIFEVTNRGGTPGELGLRFDLTVPLARFIARHVDKLGVPFKRYAIGSVFRGERPAKGRLREFVQCDCDTVGTEGVVADAEAAQVIHAALSAAGVPPFTIALNHRKILDGLLATLDLAGRSGPVLRALDKLGKIGRAGVLKELTGGRARAPVEPSATTVMAADTLWAKDPDLEAIGEPTSHKGDPAPPESSHLSEEQANRVLDFVARGRGGAEVLAMAEGELGSNPEAAEGIGRLRAVLDLLDAAGVPESAWTIDLGMARGLDYYTGVVFETTVNNQEGFGSICSGGRYDNLASLFTKRRLPGVGVSIGLDRLVALLETMGRLGPATGATPVLVAQFPGTDPSVAVRLGARLRAAGLGAEVYPQPDSVGKQLGYAEARGYKLAVIVGPDEQARQVFNLKDLAARTQETYPWAELEAAVARSLNP